MGKVFTLAEDLVVEDSIAAVPAEWLTIWGALIGPSFAAALLAIDPANDLVHVLYSVRMAADAGPLCHVAPMAIGHGVPVVCIGDGQPYLELGWDIVHAEGNIADGLIELLGREATGRVKYAAHLSDLLEERRQDHGERLAAVCIGLVGKRRAAHVPLQQRSARTQQVADGVEFDVWQPNRGFQT